jgi:hypothetical protein
MLIVLYDPPCGVINKTLPIEYLDGFMGGYAGFLT